MQVGEVSAPHCREPAEGAWNLPVEVCCRGFPGLSLWRALGMLGHLKASRASIQMAVDKEEQPMAKPGWQRRGGPEMYGRALNDKGSSSRTLVLLSSPTEVSWAG